LSFSKSGLTAKKKIIIKNHEKWRLNFFLFFALFFSRRIDKIQDKTNKTNDNKTKYKGHHYRTISPVYKRDEVWHNFRVLIRLQKYLELLKLKMIRISFTSPGFILSNSAFFSPKNRGLNYICFKIPQLTLFRIQGFFQFLLQSKNQYGVHSPFVYDFLTKCLYAKMPKTHKNKLRLFRKIFLKSEEIIEVVDKGRGSQQFNSSCRAVKDMARYSGMPWQQSKLINKIEDYFNVKTVLELGTSVGLGSIAMAANQPSTNVETVEACPKTSSFARKQFQALDLENITVFNYEFSFFLNNISDQKQYDLIYLDGHHDKKATLEYFNLLQKHIHPYSLIILDDIYWSKDMQEAWQTICRDETVIVSIDLYFWGIVFFNPNLSQQHYKIRCFF